MPRRGIVFQRSRDPPARPRRRVLQLRASEVAFTILKSIVHEFLFPPFAESHTTALSRSHFVPMAELFHRTLVAGLTFSNIICLCKATNARRRSLKIAFVGYRGRGGLVVTYYIRSFAPNGIFLSFSARTRASVFSPPRFYFLFFLFLFLFFFDVSFLFYFIRSPTPRIVNL